MKLLSSAAAAAAAAAVSLYPPPETHNIYQNDKPIPIPISIPDECAMKPMHQPRIWVWSLKNSYDAQ